jgi:hypothetical protein
MEYLPTEEKSGDRVEQHAVHAQTVRLTAQLQCVSSILTLALLTDEIVVLRNACLATTTSSSFGAAKNVTESVKVVFGGFRWIAHLA